MLWVRLKRLVAAKVNTRQRDKVCNLAGVSRDLLHFKPELTQKILKVSPQWRQIMIDEFFFSVSSPNLRFIPPTVSEEIDAEVTNTAFAI